MNLSNDSWLGDVQFSAQALDMAVVRAVEQRRWLVRASTSGPSAIIDPLGRIVAQSAPFSRATVAGRIEAGHGLTIYGWAGDAFGFLCMATTLLAVLAPAPARSSGSGSLSRGMASLRVYSRK